MVVQVQTQTVYIMARTGQCAFERYRIMSAGRHESEYKVYEARHTQGIHNGGAGTNTNRK